MIACSVCPDRGTGRHRSAMEAGQACRVIIKPMDQGYAGMARANFSALSGASRGRGATVGRDFADRQRLTAVLDGGDGFGDVHDPWGGRVGGDGQGR